MNHVPPISPDSFDCLVTLFTLLAYASGLRVTSSFVIGGASTVPVLLIGFSVLVVEVVAQVDRSPGAPRPLPRGIPALRPGHPERDRCRKALELFGGEGNPALSLSGSS